MRLLSLFSFVTCVFSASITPTLRGLFEEFSQEAENNNALTEVASTCGDLSASYQQYGCCDSYPEERNVTFQIEQQCLSPSSLNCLRRLSGRNVLITLGIPEGQMGLAFSIDPVNETLALEDWYDSDFDFLMLSLPYFTNQAEIRLNQTQCPVSTFTFIDNPSTFDFFEQKLAALDGYGDELETLLLFIDDWDEEIYNATEQVIQRTPDVKRMFFIVNGQFTNSSLGLPPSLFTLSQLEGFSFSGAGFNSTILGDLISLDVPYLEIIYRDGNGVSSYDGFTDIIIPALQAHDRIGFAYKGVVDTTLNFTEFSVPSELVSQLKFFAISFETDTPVETTVTFPEFISNFTNLIGLVIVDNGENDGVGIVDAYPESYSSLTELIALYINVQQITEFANFTEIHPQLLFFQASFFQSSPIRVPVSFFQNQFGEVRLEGELQYFVSDTDPICSTPSCNFDSLGGLSVAVCETSVGSTFCCGIQCYTFGIDKVTRDASLTLALENNGFEVGNNATFIALTPSVMQSLDTTDSGTSSDIDWLWNRALLAVATQGLLLYELEMSENTQPSTTAIEGVFTESNLFVHAFTLNYTGDHRHSEGIAGAIQDCNRKTAIRVNNFIHEQTTTVFGFGVPFGCQLVYLDFGDFGDIAPIIITVIISNNLYLNTLLWRHLQSSSISSYSGFTTTLKSGTAMRHLELRHSDAFSFEPFPGAALANPQPLTTLMLRDCIVDEFTTEFSTLYPNVHTLHIISAQYDAAFPESIWSLPLINVDLSHNPDMTGAIPRHVFQKSYERFSIENTQLNGTVFSTDEICANPPSTCHLSSHIVCADGPLSCGCSGGGPTCQPGLILESTGFQSMSAGGGETLSNIFIGDFWNTTNNVYCVVSLESGQMKFRYYNSTVPGSLPSVTYLHPQTSVSHKFCGKAFTASQQNVVSCSYYVSSSSNRRRTTVRFNPGTSSFETLFDLSSGFGSTPSFSTVSSFRDTVANASFVVTSVPGAGADDFSIFNAETGSVVPDSELTDRFEVVDGFGAPTGADHFKDLREADFNNDGLLDAVIITEDDTSSPEYVKVYLNNNDTAIFVDTFVDTGFLPGKIAVGHFSNSSIGPDFYYRKGLSDLVLCLNPLGDAVFNCSTRVMNIGIDSIITTVTNMRGGPDGVALRVYDSQEMSSYITIVEEGFQTFTLPTSTPNRVQSVFLVGDTINDYLLVYVDPTANTLNWATFKISDFSLAFL